MRWQADPDRKGATATEDRKRRGSMSYAGKATATVQVAMDLTTRNLDWAEQRQAEGRSGT